MKNKIILIILLLICINISYGNIRDYITIVKPVLYKEMSDNFLSISKYFEDEEEFGLADIFRSFANGGHGSGFIITDSNGENFIITNRHVVIYAEQVNIEIQKLDGSKIEFFNCPVIYIDDELDLAVLQFPDREKVFNRALEIETEIITDGEEVWSAGFPGLLGRPSWQLAKGNITNQQAWIEEMINTDVSYIIQHSASIDPGNSGGPLLIKNNTSESEYSVVGINTWLANNRNNTFFSIPSKNIETVLERAKYAEELKNNEDELRKELINSCNILSAELSSETPDLQKVDKIISYSFVAEEGLESYTSIVNSSDDDEADTWRFNFFNYSPLETMRKAVFVVFWNNIRTDSNNSVKFLNINYSDEDKFVNSNRIRTVFNINNNEKEIVWAYEVGHWRIVDMSLEQPKKDSEQIAPLVNNSSQEEIRDSIRRKRVIRNASFVLSGIGLGCLGTGYALYTINKQQFDGAYWEEQSNPAKANIGIGLMAGGGGVLLVGGILVLVGFLK